MNAGPAVGGSCNGHNHHDYGASVGLSRTLSADQDSFEFDWSGWGLLLLTGRRQWQARQTWIWSRLGSGSWGRLIEYRYRPWSALAQPNEV